MRKNFQVYNLIESKSSNQKISSAVLQSKYQTKHTNICPIFFASLFSPKNSFLVSYGLLNKSTFLHLFYYSTDLLILQLHT